MEWSVFATREKPHGFVLDTRNSCLKITECEDSQLQQRRERGNALKWTTTSSNYSSFSYRNVNGNQQPSVYAIQLDQNLACFFLEPYDWLCITLVHSFCLSQRLTVRRRDSAHVKDSGSQYMGSSLPPQHTCNPSNATWLSH